VNRGYRQLTTAETQWYQKLIDVMRSPNPKQSFVEIIGTDIEEGIMPETIIEDVYKNLEDEHPLLAAINFQYVKYATKWILNDHTAQNAVWGSITDEITKQITSGFKVVAVNQSKLSAFAFIERGMLDLGPTFLDAYLRTVLAMAIYGGLEHGFVAGTGVDEPIGMIRDIHEGVIVSTTDGYPAKTAVAVTKLDPATYGSVLALLAETESGQKRKFDKVYLLCNQADYLTKVMPATTALTADGRYVTNLFPYPTEVIVTNELDNGSALVGILGEYGAFAGGYRNGVIEFSD
jgi:HK97 family phage major capsid protein